MYSPKQKPPRRTLILVLGLILMLSAGCSAAGGGFLEPEPRKAVFPLPEQYTGGYTDDWGATRPQGGHEGTDIFAPRGTPVRSITASTVVDGEESSEAGWNTLGGYTVNVRAANDVGPVERGDLFYYAHLRRSTALEPGDEVEAGDKLGEVGSTGGGPPGTREAGPPHLHLGWYTASEPDQQAESGARNPYPLLERLRLNGGSFTVQPEGPFS
ncbi:M23 family metallopeptidase [Rubrobacter aplysinae]|uniref:M23 family metallopeptidase n=1 Tax=Rubrobacter aplysinae TaxID=909625 RepID=UPI0019101AEB|nr:M23 family metallopeptidase [Rubrobacter aplysinae]